MTSDISVEAVEYAQIHHQRENIDYKEFSLEDLENLLLPLFSEVNSVEQLIAIRKK